MSWVRALLPFIGQKYTSCKKGCPWGFQASRCLKSDQNFFEIARQPAQLFAPLSPQYSQFVLQSTWILLIL